MSSYASQAVVFGQAFANTMVGAWKVAPTNPLINTAKVRLIGQSGFTINPQTTIAELAAAEVDYSGYAAGGIALVVGTPVNLSAAAQGAVTGVQFLSTTATPYVGATAYGYWFDDGTNLIAGEMFAGGFSADFGAAGNYLELVLVLPVQLNQATA